MKKLTSITLRGPSLACLLACAGCSVQIRGEWNPEHPGKFEASTELEPGDDYVIVNYSPETFYVWILDGVTPLEYFPVLPGNKQRFTPTGDSFDLFTGGEQTLRGVSLWWVP